jgi:hypothetical protein
MRRRVRTSSPLLLALCSPITEYKATDKCAAGPSPERELPGTEGEPTQKSRKEPKKPEEKEGSELNGQGTFHRVQTSMLRGRTLLLVGEPQKRGSGDAENEEQKGN